MGRAGRQFRGFARVDSQIPMNDLWISSETGQNLGQWSGYRSDLGVGSLLLAGESLWLMFPWKCTQCCGCHRRDCGVGGQDGGSEKPRRGGLNGRGQAVGPQRKTCQQPPGPWLVRPPSASGSAGCGRHRPFPGSGCCREQPGGNLFLSLCSSCRQC